MQWETDRTTLSSIWNAVGNTQLHYQVCGMQWETHRTTLSSIWNVVGNRQNYIIRLVASLIPIHCQKYLVPFVSLAAYCILNVLLIAQLLTKSMRINDVITLLTANTSTKHRMGVKGVSRY